MNIITIEIAKRIALYVTEVMAAPDIDAAVMKAGDGAGPDDIISCTITFDMLQPIARKLAAVPEGAGADHNLALRTALVKAANGDADVLAALGEILAENKEATKLLEQRGQARVDRVKELYDLNTSP